MPPARKRRRGMTTEDPVEMQDSGDAQRPRIVEEDFSSSSSSTCSSSFPSSFSSSLPSSSSPPFFSLIASTSEEEEAAGTVSDSQPPLGPCASPMSAVVTLLSQFQGGHTRSREEGPSTSSQALLGAKLLLRNAIDDKVGKLVEYLLLKYRSQEQTTMVEMQRAVVTNDQELFPVIFSQASECMQLVFGIDVQEVDPQVPSYILTNSLGLSYNGMLVSEQKLPKTGVLIFILAKIFIEGNRAPEEGIWESLNMMGLRPGREHFIYGEPRELLTNVWVQEQYLEYRQVPGSLPPRYEFLWGPRAYAETSKMKVLEFFATISGSDPQSFRVWYEEALRDQEERTQARVSTMDDSTVMACAATPARASTSSRI